MTRAVLIGRWFRREGEDTHIRALASKVDLVVYGHRRPEPGWSELPSPPDYCVSRVLSPLALGGLDGGAWVYRDLGTALDSDRPDVVHVIAEAWQLVAVQVARWARRHPETAFFVHGADRRWSDVSAVKWRSRRTLARWVLARADGYLAESEEAVRTAVSFGLGPNAVTGVANTNPRDPSVFCPPADASERDAARRRLGLPRAGVGVGFIGRLVPEKGPMLFLEAFRLAAEADGRSGKVWGAVAGSGPLEPAIVTRARELGLSFLGELKEPDRAADFYRSADIVVVPSYRIPGRDDQGPRVVIEAMLSGCLLVGTRSGAIPEMIGETGLLAEEKDVASLAEAIGRALSDALLPDLRAAARQRAVELYSGASTAGTIAKLWCRAVATRREAA